MEQNYEYSFELRPGKRVYMQRKDAIPRARGIVRKVVRRYRPDPIFFHFRRKGGHVAAMHAHLDNHYFTRFDIENFFGRVTRAKVGRSLRRLKFSDDEAFEMATQSVVVQDGARILPFGFVQSPLLATLVLEQSLLGSTLKKVKNQALVTVYMDDIILSSADAVELGEISDRLVEAAVQAGFPFSASKAAIAQTDIEVFNCHLRERDLDIEGKRMDQFVTAYHSAGGDGQEAITRYINAVAPDELARFLALAAS